MSELRPFLLVEDDLRDAELALAALERCQLLNPVVHVRDGQDALDYLRHEGRFAQTRPSHPVVVVLDLKLPKLSGLDVIAEMRRDPRTRSTPVVMLTSSREEEDLVESYKLGVNAFVVKPIDFKEFLKAVNELGTFWGTTNIPPPLQG